jgi:hypothetical protein
VNLSSLGVPLREPVPVPVPNKIYSFLLLMYFYLLYPNVPVGRLSGRNLSPGRVKNFLLSTSPRLVLKPIQPPIQWVLGALTMGVKQPERLADHSPPTSAEVKNTWIHTSTPPYTFMVYLPFIPKLYHKAKILKGSSFSFSFFFCFNSGPLYVQNKKCYRVKYPMAKSFSMMLLNATLCLQMG